MTWNAVCDQCWHFALSLSTISTHNDPALLLGIEL